LNSKYAGVHVFKSYSILIHAWIIIKIKLVQRFLPCGIQEQDLASTLTCYWFSLSLPETTNRNIYSQILQYMTFISPFLFLLVRRNSKPNQWLQWGFIDEAKSIQSKTYKFTLSAILWLSVAWPLLALTWITSSALSPSFSLFSPFLLPPRF
jgi:hypothetical protein